MILSAGDLGIEIDFGLLYKEPGAILQRKEKGYLHDYLVDGEPVVKPFDVETLRPGWYRLWERQTLSIADQGGGEYEAVQGRVIFPPNVFGTPRSEYVNRAIICY